MAINLLTGFNWNEARKGYREGELEDQHDEQFLLDQQRRDLMNQQLQATMAFDDQRRPMVLQQMGQQNQLMGLNLLDAARRDELGAAQQPGTLALADTQGRYRTALANTLPIDQIAAQAGRSALASGELRLGQTENALRLLPLQGTYTANGLINAINLQPGQHQLARTNLGVAGQQAGLQSAQIGAEASLLPARTQATAQGLATNTLLSQLSGAQAQTNMDLLPQATQARTAEIQARLRVLANQEENDQRRGGLVALLDTMANPQLVQQLAAERGMDPVTYLDQLNEQIAQQGAAYNVSNGTGTVDMSTLTPATRQEALLQRAMLAGRLQGQRPQIINQRAPGGGRAGAAGAVNPITGAAGAVNPITGTMGQSQTALSEKDGGGDDAEVHDLLQTLFPTTQQIQQGVQQRGAASILPKPPPLPDNVKPADVKELSRQTNWQSFSTDDLAKILQAPPGRYAPEQLAAAGQELYKRRLAQMRSQQK